MKRGKQELYLMTIECTATNEVEEVNVFLFIGDYKKMLKRINEIVYTDKDNKEWSLKKITT